MTASHLKDSATLAEQGLTYLAPGPIGATYWCDFGMPTPFLVRLDGKVTPAMRKAEARARELIYGLRVGGTVTFKAGAYRESVVVQIAAVPQSQLGEAPSRFSMGRAAMESDTATVTIPFDPQQPIKTVRNWRTLAVPAVEPAPRRTGRRKVAA